MPKRKLISLLRKHNSQYEKETDSDLSDPVERVTKRIKPNLSSENTNDPDQYCSNNEQDNSSSFNDDSVESNDSESFHSTSDLSSKNVLPLSDDVNTGADIKTNTHYDGYQSFINSFQFFSDEESCESDSGIVSVYSKTVEKIPEAKENTNWEYQSQDVSFNEDNILIQTINDNVRVLSFYVKNLECVFMDHPSSVPIVGYLKVTLIAGKASIQGYALKINKPVTVFSQKQTGILSVTSHYSEEEQICVMQSNVKDQLTHFLSGVEADKVKDYMKKNMKYSTTVFILQNCIFPPALEFLQLYSPLAVSFENKKNADVGLKTKYTTFSENDNNVLKFGHEYEEIFTTIHKHLLRINRRKPGEKREDSMEMDFGSSEDDSENGPQFKKISGFRILVSGPKKVGKSTALRYLVNSFLNKYPEVYYLDTDPGQTEFTPPGAISLVKVTSPVFGPPYSHLRKPVKMMFTGTVTPETSPVMHMAFITKMLKYFNARFPNSILVVNTIGWLTGVGNLILQHIRKELLPAVEIELSSDLTPLSMSVEKRLLKCSVGFERNAASSTKQGDNRPADLRDWTVLAYLGQCQEYYLQPQTLNAIRPVCVCWDDIAVYNFNKRLTYNRYYEALNCSVVALCQVKEHSMLTPTNPDYPMTLEDDPENECLGYGFVRAVDEEHHLLYIVTPLDIRLISHVNALLSGNILIPRSVIYEQALDVELDFTDGSKEGRTELRKAIRKRARRQSLNMRKFQTY